MANRQTWLVAKIFCDISGSITKSHIFSFKSVEFGNDFSDKQHADEESCSAIPPILQWNSEVLPTNFAFTYHNDEAKTALNGMKM